MQRTGVTVFFQGHDHVYARETLDGVTYQTVPQPADPNQTLNFADAFPGAELRAGSGFVLVHVGPERVRVEYHRSRLPRDGTAAAEGPVADLSYEIEAPRPAPAAGSR